MPLSADKRKQFRSLGHNLKPIVTVAGNGLSEGVLVELNRALDDHELIKVKLALIEREDRYEVIEALKALPKTELVQTIGKVALLYRKAAKPNPKLSNLMR
ncbi:ribosome assembly RNA-binding protein YhbY [Gilvimarinus agarilyticus]|uniref:ribosome assembly RNA-binding protein YhbY n=1 Tax=unclassified Gilvimarinus TaxID=2642066 RepID=UPI001C09E71C|nr:MULTISPECIES: ribosome assembly RNA-binding protein YhbY [unclassified Gilvimarinus]MBU2885737.1 ribosome assembly RNA-binding protein YhbY [Gilvimarinus agarilyticus]MDO6570597.1 ribosome assembly RNA-binding protein YhbY [Gilvimarinus sp. 2_MG-2023]MDO6746188.1 ribosome assembly RNA-binding protein YhbY [Gilvimarinus sp. 1_MG-2023]